MTINAKTVLATLIASAFVAGTAHAAEAGFYFGGSVGETTVKIDDVVGSGSDFDNSDTAWKAFAGYNFIPWLGVEVGYVDFGGPSDSFLGTDVDIDLSGEEVFVVGTLPIGPVDLFVKAGGVNAKVEVDAGAFGHEDDTDQYAAWGAGAAFNFGKFAIRAEYEGYDASDVDEWYVLSVGATYHL